MALDIIAAVITYAAVGVGAWFIGGYMVKVYKGERVWLSRVIRPVERATYKVIGVDEEHEQGWISYLVSLLAVTVVSIVFTYVVLRFQDYLPFNPQNFPGVPAPLAFNTAISFATNTNWQNYTGETTMSYFSQIVGARHPPVPERGGGHGGGDRRDPRDRPANHEHARQLLGRHGARDSLHPAADQRGARARAGCQRIDPELQQLHGGPHADQRPADDRAGTGRIDGGDQGPRHQRRRLLQRQRRAPVREPQRLHQLARDLHLPADPVRPDHHVREMGRARQAGHRARRGDGHHPRRRIRGRWPGRSSRATRRWSAPARARCRPPHSAGGNMEGKEARFGPIQSRCTTPRRPARAPAPSTRHRTA